MRKTWLTLVFIHRSPPYASLLHKPTFFHRLYSGSVSPVLLDAIYAFSARHCANPTFLASLLPDQPSWARGEAFADRGRASIDQIIEVRRTWSDEERQADRGTWAETELAQALCILSCHAACLRQPRLSLYWLGKHTSGRADTRCRHLHSSSYTCSDASSARASRLVSARTSHPYRGPLAYILALGSGRPVCGMQRQTSTVARPRDLQHSVAWARDVLDEIRRRHQSWTRTWAERFVGRWHWQLGG
jgi:hypothetical protein